MADDFRQLTLSQGSGLGGTGVSLMTPLLEFIATRPGVESFKRNGSEIVFTGQLGNTDLTLQLNGTDLREGTDGIPTGEIEYLSLISGERFSRDSAFFGSIWMSDEIGGGDFFPWITAPTLWSFAGGESPTARKVEVLQDVWTGIGNIGTSNEPDFVRGFSGPDRIDGNRGNDTLLGGDGDDFINGEIGRDRLFGEAGDDYVADYNGSNTFFGGSGDDTLNAGEMFSGGGDDVMYGEAARKGQEGWKTVGHDTMWGGAGDDRMYGQRGKDTLYGQSGDDLLQGGAGADRLDGGEQADKVYGNGGQDIVLGAAGDDFLFGGPGADNVLGGRGRDVLFGGAGNDRLAGGSGADTFRFDTTKVRKQGDDRILGFDPEEDRIVVTVKNRYFEPNDEKLEFSYSGDDTVATYKGGTVTFVGELLSPDDVDWIFQL